MQPFLCELPQLSFRGVKLIPKLSAVRKRDLKSLGNDEEKFLPEHSPVMLTAEENRVSVAHSLVSLDQVVKLQAVQVGDP
jgi:hypothetical protein